VLVSVLRSVASRRVVETENPRVCAMVNWKVCKSTIALHQLQLREIVITTGFLDFVHRPEFYKQGNTTFRKLHLSPSSGEGGHLLY
jgi:hypothetical protein